MEIVTERVQKGSDLAQNSGQALDKLLRSAGDMNSQADMAQKANANLLEEKCGI